MNPNIRSIKLSVFTGSPSGFLISSNTHHRLFISRYKALHDLIFITISLCFWVMKLVESDKSLQVVNPMSILAISNKC